MKNIKLTIEYDGRNYLGWQFQPQGPTIQSELTEAIRRITDEDVILYGSGRTDSGVHAVGQVANFKTESAIPVERFPVAINSFLPPDIVVKHSREMPDDFHSQYHARWKRYRYAILNSSRASAILNPYVFQIRRELDLAKMRGAASLFLGEHEFGGFCAKAHNKDSTVRTLFKCELRKEGDLIYLDVAANGFLYNMVRAMAGALISVGREELKAEEIAEFLKSSKRDLRVFTAPPSGLCLMQVSYVDWPEVDEDARDLGCVLTFN